MTARNKVKDPSYKKEIIWFATKLFLGENLTFFVITSNQKNYDLVLELNELKKKTNHIKSRGQALTVFSDVQFIVISSPLASFTSPSIQATDRKSVV